jgi:deoxyUTP pyrophosphatase
MKKINYLKHDPTMPDLEFKNGYGNSVAIDLYTKDDIVIEAGEFALIDLGVSMQIPKGYKVDMRMRSSTFKKYGLIQTNALALIDSTYTGVDDVIKLPVFKPLTKQDIEAYIANGNYNLQGFSPNRVAIPKHTSLCQIEIVPCMEEVELNELVLEEYKEYNKTSRGGFGSTDKK